MRLARVVLAAALLTSAGWDLPTRPDRDVAEGNRAYQRGDYERALAAYRRALEGEGEPARIHFDVGAALYQLAGAAEGAQAAALYDQAESAFRRAAESRDPDLAARAYYNLGNVHFRRERYDAAISAYRVVLRLDPGRDDARHNLELALRRQKDPPSGGQGGPGQPGQPPPEPGAPGGAGTAQQPGSSGESPDDDQGDGRGQPGQAPSAPPEQPPAPKPPAPGGREPGPSGGSDTGPSAPPRPSSAGDIERKLRALERRSRELRHERLRSESRDSDAPRLQHGKDW